jgi:hypothetical protein
MNTKTKLMKAGWSSKRYAYRGQPNWCHRDQLHAVVRENVLMMHRRFEVHHGSQLDSKHETLASAKNRVMELLEAEHPIRPATWEANTRGMSAT